eukprot:TRINITY_DN12585_c0_g1_i1.p1 TRINITY_DN12585_c0_g1~~TRINITY_DN12585_c0_g1_i1.p1  ORF type:complete len:482 (-),score=62.54 TRINITY_DN12585_c0_g1_i1:94-1539(-)
MQSDEASSSVVADKAVEISSEVAQTQLRSTVISSMGIGCQYVMYTLLVATSLNLALNEMETGDKEHANKSSQLWFTVCMMTTQFISIWTSELLGQSSLWLGRKSVMRLCMCIGVLACGVALAANLSKLPAFYILAMVPLGLSFPMSPVHGVYLADISTPDKSNRNMGLAMAIASLFVTLGLLLNIPLAEVLQPLYVTAGVFALLGCALFSCIGDSSPPKETRKRPLCGEVLKTALAGPCISCKNLYKQTGFTQTLLWCVIMLQAFNSANQAWMVNYTMELLEFSSQETGLILLCFYLLLALVTGISSAYVKPGLVPCLVGLMFVPVGSILIANAGKDRVVYFLGWAAWLFPAVAGPPMLVLVMSQQPPSNRHQLVGALKLFQSMFSFIATFFSGAWAAWWLDEREKGRDVLPPCLSSLPWALLGIVFISFSFCFRGQDKKLYGMSEGNKETPGSNDSGSVPATVVPGKSCAGTADVTGSSV